MVHLHVRGENPSLTRIVIVTSWFISTCVEKMLERAGAGSSGAVHLHVRGENVSTKGG